MLAVVAVHSRMSAIVMRTADTISQQWYHKLCVMKATKLGEGGGGGVWKMTDTIRMTYFPLVIFVCKNYDEKINYRYVALFC